MVGDVVVGLPVTVVGDDMVTDVLVLAGLDVDLLSPPQLGPLPHCEWKMNGMTSDQQLYKVTLLQLSKRQNVPKRSKKGSRKEARAMLFLLVNPTRLKKAALIVCWRCICCQTLKNITKDMI